jgi:hypothetical protein
MSVPLGLYPPLVRRRTDITFCWRTGRFLSAGRQNHLLCRSTSIAPTTIVGDHTNTWIVLFCTWLSMRQYQRASVSLVGVISFIHVEDTGSCGIPFVYTSSDAPLELRTIRLRDHHDSTTRP